MKIQNVFSLFDACSARSSHRHCAVLILEARFNDFRPRNVSPMRSLEPAVAYVSIYRLLSIRADENKVNTSKIVTSIGFYRIYSGFQIPKIV